LKKQSCEKSIKEAKVRIGLQCHRRRRRRRRRRRIIIIIIICGSGRAVY
jgi:hypothetical protein